MLIYIILSSHYKNDIAGALGRSSFVLSVQLGGSPGSRPGPGHGTPACQGGRSAGSACGLAG